MSPGERLGGSVPLLVFTALALIASGLVMAAGAARLALQPGWSTARPLLLTALVLLAIGGAVATLHLGRRDRAALALAGLGRSWLSREVAAVALLAASTGGALVLELTGTHPQQDTIAQATAVLAMLCLISGLLTAITIGKVYDLQAQAGWRGPAQWLSPPASTLLLASVLLLAAPGTGRSTGPAMVLAALVLVGADTLLLAMRLAAARRRSLHGPALRFPGYAGVIRTLHLVRIALVPVTAASVVLRWHLVAPALVVAMLIIDRTCLYAGSARSTPATEMAALKLERMQRAAGRATSTT
jgi:DMSO reductase anchor subunit